MELKAQSAVVIRCCFKETNVVVDWNKLQHVVAHRYWVQLKYAAVVMHLSTQVNAVATLLLVPGRCAAKIQLLKLAVVVITLFYVKVKFAVIIHQLTQVIVVTTKF